jgi:spectinomycin phosphotransferase
MLTPPALPVDAIIARVRDAYGPRIRRATFVPHNYAPNAAFRLEAEDGTPYFLKLRGGDFDDVSVAVPAFLRAQGIRRVMAPLPALDGRLWLSGDGFTWVLYPFVAGHTGMAAPLTDAQWVALGASVSAVHATDLPPALAWRLPREDFAPRWRDVVKGFDREVGTRAYDDPLAGDLAAFWITKRRAIRSMVARAGRLGRELRRRPRPYVLCHADLHANNVLLGADGEVFIVDWDEPILAPRERDLMFVGGGVGAVWNTTREEALFYDGYGPTAIDPRALAYYRYERIVADLATYGEQIFGARGNLADRAHGLEGLKAQFLPGRVVDIAHRTYQQLP